MITKAELDKMVEDGAEKKYPDTDNHWHQIALNGFKSGASFVTGILQPEIERVENNCDTLENKAIFWMETNDRAIEHTESLQLTITTLKTEIQSLKDERDNAIKAMDYHINSDMRTQEQLQSLKDENGRIDQQRELLEKALIRVLSQPFKGDWDVQAVYIQHMLHEAKNWKALTQKAEE